MTATRRGLTFWMALAMILSLAIPFAPKALAHTGMTMEIVENEGSPATDEREYYSTTASTQTVVARVSSQVAHETIIAIEQTSGPGNTDGNTKNTPDNITCVIPTGDQYCTATITKTANSGSGRATYYAWIDSDHTQSTDNSDSDEGHYADTAECEEAEREGDPDAGDGDPEEPTGCDVSFAEPGSGCTLTDVPGQNPAAESDCTDVFVINWASSGLVATTLDCDDSGGPDTERETKGSSTDEAISSETYTCTVRDQNGSGFVGAQVKGEVENTVNDPDPTDGASYNTPDYSCTTPGDNLINGTTAGVCEITVDQLENELGTAEICFWVGDATTGQTLCSAETTGTGPDSGNNLADQVELTWVNPDSFRLDCTPETDSNPAGSAHTVTCTVTSPPDQSNPNGAPIQGYTVLVEYTGANDPDQSNSPQVPDDECETGQNGQCSFTHGPGGTGTTTATGTTTYRAWIDDGLSATDGDIPPIGVQDEDRDDTEGRDETATPGRLAEPDSTDVVEKTWTPGPATVDVQPPSDNGVVGECNPYTVTVTDADGNPLQGIVLDVEQIHANSTRTPSNDSPAVSFCTPNGTNPSGVDTFRGDLGPNSTAEDRENPDDPGTAGGETTGTTNANGVITIGISVTPANGSDGSGLVNLTVWWDPNENDDPDSSEPKDTATKNWAAAAGTGGRVIDCEPEEATTPTDQTHTVTCTVTNSTGQPQSNVDVTFTEDGPGEFTTTTQAKTNNQGQVSATVASEEGGEQTITGTITNSTQNEPDTDECNRAANDPSTGAQAGVCSDTVTNTWEEVEPQPACSDGEDNDGDGKADHPDDPGCSGPNDEDETDPDPQEKCPGYEDVPGNHVVGDEGDNQLEGTNGDDVICGLGGNDTIEGLDGDDLLVGGDGDDTLHGGEGRDEMIGGAGKDTMRGNGDNDTLKGGGGNDTMRGNAGSDEISGGGGQDAARGGKGGDFIRGGKHDDALLGGAGGDTILGGSGNDVIAGKAGRDDLRGGSGRDTINGGSGRDRCNGGPGADRITNCERGTASRRRHI